MAKAWGKGFAGIKRKEDLRAVAEKLGIDNKKKFWGNVTLTVNEKGGLYQVLISDKGSVMAIADLTTLLELAQS